MILGSLFQLAQELTSTHSSNTAFVTTMLNFVVVVMFYDAKSYPEAFYHASPMSSIV